MARTNSAALRRFFKVLALACCALTLGLPGLPAFSQTASRAPVFDPGQSLPFFGHSLLLIQIYILLLAACAAATAERLHRQTETVTSLDARSGFWHRTMRGKARADKLARFYFEGPVKIWPIILTVIRGVLLFSLCLPAIVVWRTHTQHALSFASVGFPAAVLAAAGLLARYTARAWGAVAISVVSGTCILILFWTAFSASLLRLRLVPPSAAELGAHLQAGEMSLAGYLIGFTIIFGTTLAMGADFTRAALFDTPPLEHRHVNPLHSPLPLESRKRLRIFAFNALIAVALAVSPLGLSSLPLIALVLTTALQIWGWRDKEMGPRQLVPVAFGTAAASLLLWVFYSAGDIGALHKSMMHTENLLNSLASRPPSATWAALVSGGLLLRLPVIIACILILLLSCGMLQRPPAHLFTILGHAPVWGWMLLATASAACFASFFSGGPALAEGMLLTVLTAFIFIWLERAEIL